MFFSPQGDPAVEAMCFSGYIQTQAGFQQMLTDGCFVPSSVLGNRGATMDTTQSLLLDSPHQVRGHIVTTEQGKY